MRQIHRRCLHFAVGFGVALGALLVFRPGWEPLTVKIYGAPLSRWQARVDTGSGYNDLQKFETGVDQLGAPKEFQLTGRPLRGLLVTALSPVKDSDQLQAKVTSQVSQQSWDVPLIWRSHGVAESGLLNLPTRGHPINLVFAQIILATLVGMFCVWGGNILRVHRRWPTTWNRPLLMWGGLAVVWGLWWWGQWPGMLSYDSLLYYTSASASELSDWSSYLYSLYYLIIYQISEQPAFLGVVQIFGFAAIGVYLLERARIWGAPRGVVWTAFTLLALMPHQGMMANSYFRDSLYGWVEVLFVMSIPALALRSSKDSPISFPMLGGLAFSAAGMAYLRTEGFMYVFWYPLALALLRVLRPRRALALMTITFLLYGLIDRIIPMVLPIHRAEQRYQVTAMVNPLGFILNQNYSSHDRSEDRRIIDTIFDYNRLTQMADPYEIPAFHSGGCRVGFSQEEFRAFRQRYFKIVFENLGLFLENRLRMFWAMLGFAHSRFYDDALLREFPVGNEFRSRFGIIKSPLSPRLFYFQKQWLARFLYDSGGFELNQWVSSAGVSLALAIISVLLYPLAPACAVASALLLTRIGALALTSPSSQFKYLYSLYLFGFFLVPWFFAERSRRRIKAVGFER